MRTRLLLLPLAPPILFFGWVLGSAFGLFKFQPSLYLPAILVASVAGPLSIVWSTHWKLRFARRLVEARGRVCFRCGYDLAGLGDAGQCPECGVPYLVESLREQWVASGLCAREQLLPPTDPPSS